MSLLVLRVRKHPPKEYVLRDLQDISTCIIDCAYVVLKGAPQSLRPGPDGIESLGLIPVPG